MNRILPYFITAALTVLPSTAYSADPSKVRELADYTLKHGNVNSNILGFYSLGIPDPKNPNSEYRFVVLIEETGIERFFIGRRIYDRAKEMQIEIQYRDSSINSRFDGKAEYARELTFRKNAQPSVKTLLINKNDFDEVVDEAHKLIAQKKFVKN